MKKRILLIIFFSIIYLPFVLGLTSKLISKKCDVSLEGYTDEVGLPEYSWASFSSGKYQNDYMLWYTSSLLPRGILTRTYNTIQYSLFDIGNNIIGYNKDIFEKQYIVGELCLENQFDYSIEGNQETMKSFVNSIVTVRDKLKRINKELYIYIAPSKAHFDMKNIPDKYKKISKAKRERAVDYFEKLISDTDVSCLICADMQAQLEYPAFYRTGIHWSRTYEQSVSQKIISDLKVQTGNNYRNIGLGTAKVSNKPFDRDADVYNLLNLWLPIKNIDYYEYSSVCEFPEKYDKMQFLIYGDSFGLGLRKDILDNYPNEEINYINYDNYLLDPQGNHIMINKSWDNLDLSSYLDESDVVIIEMTEPYITQYTLGFVEYLQSVLNDYKPNASLSKEYMKELDYSNDMHEATANIKGLYLQDTDYAWAQSGCEVILQDKNITRDGLEIIFDVPEQLFTNSPIVNLYTYINGVKVCESVYYFGGTNRIIVPSNYMNITNGNNDIYDIEIYCDSSFNPSEQGMSADNRKLSIAIRYIGRKK